MKKVALTNFRKISICFLASVLVLLLSSLSPVSAQEAMAQEDKFSMSVSLNSDAFFGFYPFFAGSYAANDNLDFTFYGILWSGGTGGGWGNWTEFGVGVNFPVAEGINVNPQLGVLGGNLLSSGAAGPAVFGDGIVPNLTMGLDREKVEGEIYLGYYLPLRDETTEGETTLAFLHYWANIGFKASPFFSFGAHFEHLINTGGSEVESSTDTYQWFGPYVQFAKPSGGAFTRFSFGPDLLEGNDSFYKLTVGYDF